MTRPLLFILSFALLGAIAGMWAGHWVLSSKRAPLPSIQQATVIQPGDPVPAVILTDPDGQPRLLASAPGRLRIVNFWASWCAPCVEEMPVLDAFARQQAGNNVDLVGIALDDPAAVRHFLNRVPVGYPILIAEPGSSDLSVQWGNGRGVLPFSMLIGPDGQLRATHAGRFDAEALTAWVVGAR